MDQSEMRDDCFSHLDTYRVCVRSGDRWVYQGDSAQLRIHFYSQFMPVWVMAILVSVLLCLSGLSTMSVSKVID